jgi:hypothetical protein
VHAIDPQRPTDGEMRSLVCRLFDESLRTCGAPRIGETLRQQGYAFSNARLSAAMAVAGIFVRAGAAKRAQNGEYSRRLEMVGRLHRLGWTQVQIAQYVRTSRSRIRELMVKAHVRPRRRGRRSTITAAMLKQKFRCRCCQRLFIPHVRWRASRPGPTLSASREPKYCSRRCRSTALRAWARAQARARAAARKAAHV